MSDICTKNKNWYKDIYISHILDIKPNTKNMQKEQAAQNVGSRYPTRINEAKKYEYNYWKAKPVTGLNDDVLVVSQNIEPTLDNRKVYASTEEIKLPESMQWVSVDINDDTMMENVSKFLKKYYAADDSGQFTFNYTAEFLKWAIGKDNICLAITAKNNGAICGFIANSFKTITVFESTKRHSVVDFLCAHPIYRTKKIAPVLIDEVIRRFTKIGIHQGCFTTERWVPTPTATFRFYHRPLNYVKLQKYGFIDLEVAKRPNKRDPAKMQKHFDIAGQASCIPMTLDHIEQVRKVYNTYINRYNIYVNYDTQELTDSLLGNTNIVKSFVYVDKDNNVVDFFSYYKLSSAILNETEVINGGYLFLYSCNMNPSNLITDVMRTMRDDNIDVLNVTDTMIIPELIYTDPLKFGEDSDDESTIKSYQHRFVKGSGKIHFNFFNWKCPKLTPDRISWTSF